MAQITYTNKNKAGSAPVNQWRDVDANEVKDSVNNITATIRPFIL